MILLDTAVLVHLVNADGVLGHEREALLQSDLPRGLSATSLLELGEWVDAGKLELRIPFRLWLEAALDEAHVLVIPLSPAILARAVSLGKAAGDFHDRVILATALEEDLELATLNLQSFGVGGLRLRF